MPLQATHRRDQLLRRGLVFEGTLTKDFGSISANARDTQTVTIAGAIVGAPVTLGWNTIPVAGIIFTAAVTAVDTVTVYADNTTTGSVDPASTIFTIAVRRMA